MRRGRALESDYVVLSSFGNCNSAWVTMLAERSLNADVNLAFAGDGSQLVVADFAERSFSFRVVAVYAPNCAVERGFFF